MNLLKSYWRELEQLKVKGKPEKMEKVKTEKKIKTKKKKTQMA